MCLSVNASVMLKGAVVVLNGTSCAGKTTMSRYILEKVESRGHYISTDDIEHSLKEIGDRDGVEKRARFVAYAAAKKAALAGKVAVLDAFIPDRGELDQLKGVAVIHLLLYAPFQTLIERDQHRMIEFSRGQAAQEAAQGFILECFRTLYRPCRSSEQSLGEVQRSLFNTTFQSHLTRDGDAPYSYVAEEAQRFLKTFFGTKYSRTPITPCNAYDYVFDTSKKSVKEEVLRSLIPLLEGKDSKETKERKAKDDK